MASRASTSNWSEILCCLNCSQLFSYERLPININCGVLCSFCVKGSLKIKNEKIKVPKDVNEYPVNLAYLHILGINPTGLENLTLAGRLKSTNVAAYANEVEKIFVDLSNYLKYVKTERGGAVSSDCLSRLVQRRLVSILNAQLYTEEGRTSAVRLTKSIAERVVTELVLSLQSSGNLSSYLWSAVRARGCQFLGPAMQEDVLKLILLALAHGELIARKTLVLYIVQTMSDDYPHVSKTCVGHVVQLLYRASCFNVIKRDGESSLMQLKPEFRDYDFLRLEHDKQIIQIALEAGLRISSDQWSSLLYGDNNHRSYIDSIIDTLQLSPNLLSQTISELRALLQRNGDPNNIVEIFPTIEQIFQSDSENSSDFLTLRILLSSLKQIFAHYSKFFKSRGNESKFVRKADPKQPIPMNGQRLYKTRLCRDVLNGQICPRGKSCSYAHNSDELRPSTIKPGNEFLELQQPPPMMPMNAKMDEMPPNVFVPPPTMIPQPLDVPPTMPTPLIPIVPVVVPQTSPLTDMQMEQAGMMKQGTVLVGNYALQPNADGTLPNTAQIMLPTCPTNPNAVFFPIIPPPMTLNQQQSFQGVVTTVQPICPPTILPTPIGQPLNNSIVFATAPPPTNPQPIWFNDEMNDNQANIRKSSYNPRMSNGSTGSTPQSNGYSVNGGHKTSNSAWGDNFSDDQHLLARRNEIVSRLSQMRATDTDEDDLDSTSHVSYTVAFSVLAEEIDPAPTPIELPPMPAIHSLPLTIPDSILPPRCVGSLVAIPADITTHSLRNSSLSRTPPKNDLLNNVQIPITTSATMWSSVRTACPTSFCHMESTKPATVQAHSSTTNTTDMFERPLMISTIQPHNFLVSPQASLEMIDPCNFHVPQVLKSLPLNKSPQSIVAQTIESIINVKERILDVNMKGGLGSSVERAQLNIELNIVNQQISTLDKQTKQSCLLKELEAIDRKIEDLNVSA